MSFVVCVCAVAGALLDTAFVFKALGDPLGILSGVSWGVSWGVFWGLLGNFYRHGNALRGPNGAVKPLPKLEGFLRHSGTL